MTKDAFTISWENENFYAFLLFSLILKTLPKIKSEKAEVFVFVLDWSGQAWFPLISVFTQAKYKN